MKNDRLFQIIYILLQKENITAPKLAELLEVSVRTIYRDIETLSISGVPICASSGKGGGISLVSGYTFDKALLSGDEQSQVLFAIQSLKAADQSVDLLLNKLGNMFQNANSNWIEVDFSRWGFKKTDRTKFETLKRAILSKKILNITYCNSSGITSKRDIKPVKLIFKDKNWYVQGFCMNAGGFRLFKINRILELALTDSAFGDDFGTAPSIEADLDPHAQNIMLRLKFSQSVAFRVFDEFEAESIKKNADGSLSISFPIPDDSWICSYLMSFGTGVEVLEPLELKSRLSDYAKSIHEHHKVL